MCLCVSSIYRTEGGTRKRVNVIDKLSHSTQVKHFLKGVVFLSFFSPETQTLTCKQQMILWQFYDLFGLHAISIIMTSTLSKSISQKNIRSQGEIYIVI